MLSVLDYIMSMCVENSINYTYTNIIAAICTKHSVIDYTLYSLVCNSYYYWFNSYSHSICPLSCSHSFYWLYRQHFFFTQINNILSRRPRNSRKRGTAQQDRFRLKMKSQRIDSFQCDASENWFFELVKPVWRVCIHMYVLFPCVFASIIIIIRKISVKRLFMIIKIIII